MDEQNLATELLKEIKASAKRWFIIALVELFLILMISGIFIWHLSLPVSEQSIEYTQEADDNVASDIQQFIGDHKDGKSETDSQKGN